MDESLGVYTKYILEKFNLNAKKRFGQNFLIDKNIINKIIEDINKDDVVLEIGTGIACLTREIAKKAKKVYSIEIDKKLEEAINFVISDCDNVEMIFSDFLKIDLVKLLEKEKNVHIVSNLPYYLSSDIMMKLLYFKSEFTKIESISLMMQKEVWDRIIASPSTKHYDLLSIAVDFACLDKYIVTNVSKTAFIPNPHVKSIVLKFIIKQNNYNKEFIEFYRKTQVDSFSMRRKTLINNLSKNKKYEKEKIKNILEDLGFAEDIRAEALNSQDFLKLSEKLFETL